MTDTQDDTFVSGYLLYLLAASSEQASTQFHDHVRARGLRVPEWRVLACLVDNDGMMITRLARLSLMEQSRMTRIVDQMDARGLVTRGADANDKRRVRVRLTAEGRDLAESLVKDARRHETRLLSALADTDAARIKGVLRTLLDVLDKPDPA
ncbi:MarR family winged helix-turn-helix transcriptional regulator [Ruegeria marina]|uniref:Transcriptional regulator, MarR family n=1 Tax=Ruegeria marina TaxID=639004 RepID=A0A1G6SMH6_9RHOB|nr:MarR family winged helix-turn-helix transcriptional regulator [Ruegeria marina]SDD17417.1 transcriptional regulator, MarR family [Ruegeria marina]